MSFLSDSSNPPVTEVARIANASPQADTEQMFAIVLPGNYYECKVIGPTDMLIVWTEYS